MKNKAEKKTHWKEKEKLKRKERNGKLILSNVIIIKDNYILFSIFLQIKCLHRKRKRANILCKMLRY